MFDPPPWVVSAGCALDEAVGALDSPVGTTGAVPDAGPLAVTEELGATASLAVALRVPSVLGAPVALEVGSVFVLSASPAVLHEQISAATSGREEPVTCGRITGVSPKLRRGATMVAAIVIADTTG